MNPDGSIRNWREEISIPEKRWLHSAILVNNDMYVFGGSTNWSCCYSLDLARTVLKGTIDAEGRISEWKSVKEIPTKFVSGAAVAYVPNKDFAIYTGGAGCNSTNQVLIIGSLASQAEEYQAQSDSEGVVPLDRLGKWNETSNKWEPLRQGELTSGNVHVLVHGWAPGRKKWVTDELKTNPLPKAWENIEFFEPFSDLAASISEFYKGLEISKDHGVLAYSWIDHSATESILMFNQDMGLATEANLSLASTYDSGIVLASALVQAGLDSNFVSNGGKTQFLGHSHGARVSILAAIELENLGVHINHVTFFDSPEHVPLFPDKGLLYDFSGGLNNITNILLTDKTRGLLTVGYGPHNTFIDNYYTAFGLPYPIWNVVNVDLSLHGGKLPNHSSHIYPVTWYKRATDSGEGFGIQWSPLMNKDTLVIFSNNYVQATDKPLRLLSTELLLPPKVPKNETLVLNKVLTRGTVEDIPNGISLTESSSAYWHGSFSKSTSGTSIRFDFRFTGHGDGDQLGIWIDDRLEFLSTGDVSELEIRTAFIDIENLALGPHLLTISLHSVGSKNASVEISNFMVISTSTLDQVSFKRGDCNVDGSTDISDSVYILLILFGGLQQSTCTKASDCDDSGAIDVTDAVVLLETLFLNKGLLRQPIDSCGFDLTIDSLSCELFEQCK